MKERKGKDKEKNGLKIVRMENLPHGLTYTMLRKIPTQTLRCQRT
jgi:hypothetical protein